MQVEPNGPIQAGGRGRFSRLFDAFDPPLIHSNLRILNTFTADISRICAERNRGVGGPVSTKDGFCKGVEEGIKCREREKNETGVSTGQGEENGNNQFVY